MNPCLSAFGNLRFGLGCFFLVAAFFFVAMPSILPQRKRKFPFLNRRVISGVLNSGITF